MGHLLQGKWHNDEVATSNESGEFDREKSSFREMISSEHETFQPDKGRYHLYVSYACPWAHRALIARELKDLQGIISVSVVHPHMLENSWTFDNSFPEATKDHLYDKNYLYEIYQMHDPKMTSKVTVPVLWDKKTKKIVNNESSEILRIFNSAFNGTTGNKLNLYPENLQKKIDEINDKVYEPINNGVYKTGFAKNQKSYEKAFKELFNALDWIEKHLSDRKYLVGETLTEADIRLMTTLIRFDCVYHTHFKCNYKKISEYKKLSTYLSDIFNSNDAFKKTTNFDHIKRHYYYSHDFINPHRIVAIGPEVSF